MQKFKELSLAYPLKKIEFPSISFNSGSYVLHLRFDSKDRLLEASYEGKFNLWLSAIVTCSKFKTPNELKNLSWKDLDIYYEGDQAYWDAKQEKTNDVFFPEKEIFSAAASLFLGKDLDYKNKSALVCRCFNVREDEIIEYLQTDQNPSIEGIGSKLKAAMGCRSCLTQIKRWISSNDQESKIYKNKPYSDWIIEIDYLLSCFPKAEEWKMVLKSFKNQNVIIEFDAVVGQEEEEKVGRDLQSFLEAGTDAELSFFLVRV